MLCFIKKSLTQDRRVISGRENMSMNCFMVWPWELCRTEKPHYIPMFAFMSCLCSHTLRRKWSSPCHRSHSWSLKARGNLHTWQLLPHQKLDWDPCRTETQILNCSMCNLLKVTRNHKEDDVQWVAWEMMRSNIFNISLSLTLKRPVLLTYCNKSGVISILLITLYPGA